MDDVLITRAADAMSDLLTMLGVDPSEHPDGVGRTETTARVLARAALTSAGVVSSSVKVGERVLVVVRGEIRSRGVLVENPGQGWVQVAIDSWKGSPVSLPLPWIQPEAEE